MMRSCLSSQKLRKDVVDSLRPSRRHVVTDPNSEKRKILQQSFGGQPLPLPKPEPELQDCVGDSPEPADHGNQSPLSSRRNSGSYFEEDDTPAQLMFGRASTRTPLCFPPPPVSSPTSSSGKRSPSASTEVVCKATVQEHPSPAQNDPPPPPPWSSSSSLSLNDSSSPPWCSPVALNPRPPSPPRIILETTPLLPISTLLPCARSGVGDVDPPLQSSLLTSSSSSSLSKCSGSIVSEALEVADIRKDVKVFGLHEIERACSEGNREHGIAIVGDVSVITTWIGEDDGELAKRSMVAVVCKHRHSHQGLKDWAAKVNLISRVDDHHVCKLKGYCGSDEEQILVYEHVCNGSLSDYLFGSLCKALLDWRSRVRIALGAARALACIHDLAPIEVVYKDFKSSNILLDLDFSVKLAGQGLDVIAWEDDRLNKAASKVLRKSEASAKRNIRSFGVFLVELLTGKSITSEQFVNDENLFIKWAKPYLREQDQLAIIIDPHLRRQHPCSRLKKVAALTLQCLRKDPDKRPSISEVVEVLDSAMIHLKPASCKRIIRNRDLNKCLSLGRSFQHYSPLKLGFSRRSLSNKQF